MAGSIRELRTELLVNHWFQLTGCRAIKWVDGQLFAYDFKGDCYEICNMHPRSEVRLTFASLFEHFDHYYRFKDCEHFVSVH